MGTAQKSTLRQDVWDAAYKVVGGMPDGRELADKIVDRFTNSRATNGSVSSDVKAKIAADLEAGGYSFAKLRDKYGVGMSTVQRVATELRARGTTVRTSGQTNPGNTLN